MVLLINHRAKAQGYFQSNSPPWSLRGRVCSLISPLSSRGREGGQGGELENLKLFKKSIAKRWYAISPYFQIWDKW